MKRTFGISVGVFVMAALFHVWGSDKAIDNSVPSFNANAPKFPLQFPTDLSVIYTETQSQEEKVIRTEVLCLRVNYGG